MQMHYRKLGQTGLTVSVVGLGTWQLGGEWGANFRSRTVRDMIQTAREQGINLIDTDPSFGDHTAERLVGQAIYDDRENWVLVTKFGSIYSGPFTRQQDYSIAAMRRQLEASLQALNTDYIDLYMLHGMPMSTYEDQALWDALEEEKANGRIRAIGVSMQPYADRLDRPQIQVLQTPYSLLQTQAQYEVLPLCQKKGIGVLVREPLASGLLSGKYEPGHRWTSGDIRSLRPAQQLDEELAQVQRIRREQAPEGVSLAAWSLAWCLRHPAVSAVLPGCRTDRQIKVNASACQMETGQATHPLATGKP